MTERPAPLVLVTTPADGQPFGSHAAVAAEGQRLLAADLSIRLGALGAAVAPLPFAALAPGTEFTWGGWFTGAAREALDAAAGAVDAIGYAGGGALEILSAAREEHEVDALVGEPPGDRLAYAFTRAGHNRRATP